MQAEAVSSEAEEIARSSGLTWPGASSIGLFALHTTAAAICGIHLGPWLLSRWFAWVVPLLGGRPSEFAADYWLQHLEWVSIVPALLVGYVSCRYLRTMAVYAWIVPTAILGYRLLTFTDPHASVLATNPWSRFSYYFVIERFMPTFYADRGADPIRVAAQLAFVSPFYSGVAYSIGALTEKSNLLRRIAENVAREPEPEVIEPEESDETVTAKDGGFEHSPHN